MKDFFKVTENWKTKLFFYLFKSKSKKFCTVFVCVHTQENNYFKNLINLVSFFSLFFLTEILACILVSGKISEDYLEIINISSSEKVLS